MSPTPDAGGWQELWLSLTFEQQPSGALLARLAVDESADRLVEVELPGELLARLLAGETVLVQGRVTERLSEDSVVELDVEEPTEAVQETEPQHDEPANGDAPGPAVSWYSAALDAPPPGTVPIMRTTEVARDEAVVAYLRGRWRDAIVVSKDVGTLFVSYSREGRDRRQRVPVGWVRRRT
jgi:hypothetical protein